MAAKKPGKKKTPAFGPTSVSMPEDLASEMTAYGKEHDANYSWAVRKACRFFLKHVREKDVA